jgi:hypothetical protein
MALSNSMIKIAERKSLYFNKYTYKASFEIAGAFWLRYCKTPDEFSNRPDHMLRDPDEFGVIEFILTLSHNLREANADVRFRYDYNQLSLFTNDVDLIKQLTDSKYQWLVEQAKPNPDGTIYFARKKLPGKYRTYLTPKATNYYEELIEYFNKNSSMNPSKKLSYHLNFVKNTKVGINVKVSPNYWKNWADVSSRYVDYDDERQLMMMTLLFPGAIGKSYKLEKKPS